MKNNKPYTIRTIVVGDLGANCYLFTENSSGKTLIIDPGSDASVIAREIEASALVPEAIVNTHGHVDHIGANGALKKKYKIPIYLHSQDAGAMDNAFVNGSVLIGPSVVSPAADVLVKEGDIISAGSLKLKVLHTPGHTPGGICLMNEELIFTGDTLFGGSIGRTDLHGGSDADMAASLKKLKGLAPQLAVFPGHGPATTILEELSSNPFLNSDSGWN